MHSREGSASALWGRVRRLPSSQLEIALLCGETPGYVTEFDPFFSSAKAGRRNPQRKTQSLRSMSDKAIYRQLRRLACGKELLRTSQNHIKIRSDSTDQRTILRSVLP